MEVNTALDIANSQALSDRLEELAILDIIKSQCSDEIKCNPLAEDGPMRTLFDACRRLERRGEMKSRWVDDHLVFKIL